MDQALALHLTDIRLLQTWHLLNQVLDGDHDSADRESINAALEAISHSHEIVKKLKASAASKHPAAAPSAA